MLKVSVSYVDGAKKEMPIIESLDAGTVKVTANRILKEYAQGAQRCTDEVLAALIRSEIHQATSVLRAAGLEVQGA